MIVNLEYRRRLADKVKDLKVVSAEEKCGYCGTTHKLGLCQYAAVPVRPIVVRD